METCFRLAVRVAHFTEATGITAGGVAALALASAHSAIFSVVNGVVLRAFPTKIPSG